MPRLVGVRVEEISKLQKRNTAKKPILIRERQRPTSSEAERRLRIVVCVCAPQRRRREVTYTDRQARSVSTGLADVEQAEKGCSGCSGTSARAREDKADEADQLIGPALGDRRCRCTLHDVYYQGVDLKCPELPFLILPWVRDPASETRKGPPVAPGRRF
ncbi:hypothetical protein F5148DRAFT_239948 [Russula earlei]|uniref:Uncharacterized protein n=1 Tax=Russula earlei TaxID=71964 RepID=A0ACC0TRB5_9AGAM|nr:hypothetical protein F5148DRAFT_239948 [Russula earlei]